VHISNQTTTGPSGTRTWRAASNASSACRSGVTPGEHDAGKARARRTTATSLRPHNEFGLRLPARQHGVRTRPTWCSAATSSACVDEVGTRSYREASTTADHMGPPDQATSGTWTRPDRSGASSGTPTVEVDEKKRPSASWSARSSGSRTARHRQPLRVGETPSWSATGTTPSGEGAVQR